MNAKLFGIRNYNQAKTNVNNIKLQLFKILLICILITVPIIGSNVLKYLDPGSGSMLIQTIMGMSSCAICGIPVAIIGAVVYFFTKKKNSNSQSDSTKETDS
ncbi:MAG: hypothetical protein K8S20_05115 [Chloroflexi bacterium]|nr:hypothetical protein [Chloroflexota bacterium]